MNGKKWSDFDRYLRGEHLNGKVYTLTIRDITIEETHPRPGVKQMSPICHFAETSKALILSPTNQAMLGRLFGDDVESSIGKRVKIKAVPMNVAGRDTLPVRIYGVSTDTAPKNGADPFASNAEAAEAAAQDADESDGDLAPDYTGTMIEAPTGVPATGHGPGPAQVAEQRARDKAALFGEESGDESPASPESKPENVKRAELRVEKQVKEWRAGLAALVKAHTQYQAETKGHPNGQPNLYHVLGAAAKCGFHEITDANWEVVIEAVYARSRATQETRDGSE
jgi:hypothetical protein